MDVPASNLWASAVFASLVVMVACASRKMSATTIQCIIILSLLWSLYCTLVADKRVESFDESESPSQVAPPTDLPPNTGSLHHFFTGKTTKAVLTNQGLSATQFTRTDDVITGPPSNECHVFKDFVLFCTVKGASGDGSLVDIKAINASDELTNVGIDVVTSDGIGYVKGNIGGAKALVKLPDGIDAASCVLSRTGKEMRLRIVSPLQDEDRSETQPCETEVKALVNKAMTINSGKVVSEVLNFGIYGAALDAAQALDVTTYLKRTGLLESPIVRDLNDSLTSSTQALESAKTTNPFGSDKIGSMCASSVPDWTRPQYSTASTDCKREIVSHCTLHPESEGCECWDKKSAAYSGNACTNYRNMFNDAAPVDLQNLDAKDLATIKSKYNLSEAVPEAVPEAQSTVRVDAPRSRVWYDYFLGTTSAKN